MEPIFAAAWYLTGPTASGKSAVALALAERLGAEVLSLDSMAIYRGMDIGTAKPSAAERAAVPHHLLDLVAPSEPFSVADYCSRAKETAEQILARGKVPLFVGGTPLYLKGLLRGLFAGPPADPALRQRLAAIAETEGPEQLHRMLSEVDPQRAAKLPPSDVRRLIRALEVFETTGQPISSLQTQFDRKSAATHVYCLRWPRAVLVERIDRRVEHMFASGLVAEVKQLAAAPGGLGPTALQGIGYREVLEYLQGARSLAETVELVKLRTRQFAKRQMTWFRALAECQFIDLEGDLPARQIAAQILQLDATVPPLTRTSAERFRSRDG